MRGSPILLVVLVGLVPLVVFTSLVLVPTAAKWGPSVIWTSEFGTLGQGDSGNKVTGLSSDSSGIYLVGYVGRPANEFSHPSPSYLFLKKYDFSGHELWSQHLGDPRWKRINDVNVRNNDGVYLLGHTNDTVFIEKHGLNGNLVWTSQIENLTGNSPLGLSAGDSGVYVVGHVNGTSIIPIILRDYDIDGNLLWTRVLENKQLALFVFVYASNNGVYLVSSRALSSPPSSTYSFLSLYSSNGTPAWTRSFDNQPVFTCMCEPTAISGDTSGVYVGGITENHFPGSPSGSLPSPFIRKFDWNGNVVWTAEFDIPLRDLQVLISAGQSGLYGVGAGILRLDGSNGKIVWTDALAGQPSSLTLGRDAVYVGGSSTANQAFIAGYSMSSSLILFGVNSPISFVIAALIIGVPVTAFLWIGRRSLKKGQPSRGSKRAREIKRLTD